MVMRPAPRLDSGAGTREIIRALVVLLLVTAMIVFTWMATKNSPQFNIQYAFYAITSGLFAIIAK